jgi:Uma2 family endonuclease
MGWLIDPEEQTVFVYRPGQELEVLDGADQIIAVPRPDSR